MERTIRHGLHINQINLPTCPKPSSDDGLMASLWFLSCWFIDSVGTNSNQHVSHPYGKARTKLCLTCFKELSGFLMTAIFNVDSTAITEAGRLTWNFFVFVICGKLTINIRCFFVDKSFTCSNGNDVVSYSLNMCLTVVMLVAQFDNGHATLLQTYEGNFSVKEFVTNGIGSVVFLG